MTEDRVGLGVYTDDDGKPGRLIARVPAWGDVVGLRLEGRHWLLRRDDDGNIRVDPFMPTKVCAVCCKPYEPHGFDGLGECPDCATRGLTDP